MLFIVDVMVKDYQSSSSISHKVSSIYSNSNEINKTKGIKIIDNYSDFQNKYINKITSTQKHTSKVNPDSIYPKGLHNPKNSNLLNENPIESSETPYQTSSINEYSKHTKNYKDIKGEDENYNVEDIGERDVHGTHQNKISDKTKINSDKLKWSRTPIGGKIVSPPMEESKDNTSNEKEINPTASTNKE